MLSICYITSRKNPKLEWFINSLNRELMTMKYGYHIPELVIVDFYHGKMERYVPGHYGGPVKWCSPKPTPWQGDHRLTDHDAFAASNARNTGICLAAGDYIVFVDDLSVLVNGWLSAVDESVGLGRVVFGAYRKVKDLAVDERGNIIHWIPHDGGVDARWKEGLKEPIECIPQWLFGCSFGAPTKALLDVNGFDEALDGLSFEDVCLGLRLAKAGYKTWYDQRMLTFESEELHHTPGDEKFARHNRPIDGFKDCAWEMLDWIQKNPPASRGTPNLTAIRNDVLSGKPFPNHSGFFVWPDGKSLL